MLAMIISEEINPSQTGDCIGYKQVAIAADSECKLPLLLVYGLTAMAPKSCALCRNAKAILRRPKTGQQICKDCFFKVFETEVYNTIMEARLFKTGR